MAIGLFRRFINTLLGKKSESSQFLQEEETYKNIERMPSESINYETNDEKKIEEADTISKYINDEQNVKFEVEDEIKHTSRDLYIGFDLGTSCSKVVVRDNIDKTVIPIKFNDFGYDSNPFLLPSKIYLRQDKLSMEQLMANDIEIKDIKSKFINNIITEGDFPSSSVILISYLALSLRYLRNYVIQKRAIYKKTQLHWHVNIGIPCLDVQNDILVEKYEKAILYAWNISLKDEFFPNKGSIVIDLVENYTKEAEKNNEKNLDPMKDYIFVFPELFASIKSQIDQKRLDINKMYYMVDVGAGTVDMATFNLFNDGEQNLNYAIFVPTIKEIGSYRFGIDLINSLAIDNESAREIQDILLSLSEGNREYDLYDKFGHEVILNNIYDKYIHEYKTQIGTTILKTKNEFYPNALEWAEGIPTFIVGGGRQFKVHNEKFYELFLKNEFYEFHTRGISNPNIINAYPPDYFNNENLIINNYHRFLVADGLADDKYNLGRILTNVRKIENYEDSVLNIDEIYVGQDMT